MNKLMKIFGALILVIALGALNTACGGDGGGNDDVTNPGNTPDNPGGDCGDEDCVGGGNPGNPANMNFAEPELELVDLNPDDELEVDSIRGEFEAPVGIPDGVKVDVYEIVRRNGITEPWWGTADEPGEFLNPIDEHIMGQEICFQIVAHLSSGDELKTSFSCVDTPPKVDDPVGTTVTTKEQLLSTFEEVTELREGAYTSAWDYTCRETEDYDARDGVLRIMVTVEVETREGSGTVIDFWASEDGGEWTPFQVGELGGELLAITMDGNEHVRTARLSNFHADGANSYFSGARSRAEREDPPCHFTFARGL